MMKKDLGITKVDFAEEKRRAEFEKNLVLFNRFLDVL
jgi:hypothetical protein